MKKTTLNSLFAALLCLGAVAPVVAMQSEVSYQANPVYKMLTQYWVSDHPSEILILNIQPALINNFALLTTPALVRTVGSGEEVIISQTPQDLIDCYTQNGQHPELTKTIDRYHRYNEKKQVILNAAQAGNSTAVIGILNSSNPSDHSLQDATDDQGNSIPLLILQLLLNQNPRDEKKSAAYQHLKDKAKDFCSSLNHSPNTPYISIGNWFQKNTAGLCAFALDPDSELFAAYLRNAGRNAKRFSLNEDGLQIAMATKGADIDAMLKGKTFLQHHLEWRNIGRYNSHNHYEMVTILGYGADLSLVDPEVYRKAQSLGLDFEKAVKQATTPQAKDALEYNRIFASQLVKDSGTFQSAKIQLQEAKESKQRILKAAQAGNSTTVIDILSNSNPSYAHTLRDATDDQGNNIPLLIVKHLQSQDTNLQSQDIEYAAYTKLKNKSKVCGDTRLDIIPHTAWFKKNQNGVCAFNFDPDQELFAAHLCNVGYNHLGLRRARLKAAMATKDANIDAKLDGKTFLQHYLELENASLEKYSCDDHQKVRTILNHGADLSLVSREVYDAAQSKGLDFEKVFEEAHLAPPNTEQGKRNLAFARANKKQ